MAERKHILLAAINAKYIHSNLAVYSLKAYAKKYQDQIGLAEYTINQNPDDILKGIYRDHPEVLCISCYIWNISYVRNLIREVHKVLLTQPSGWEDRKCPMMRGRCWRSIRK